MIDGMARRKPLTSLPDFESRIEALIAQNRLRVPEEIRLELLRNSVIEPWLRRQKSFVEPFNATQQTVVIHIQTRFPDFVNTLTRQNEADPFLIALAKCRGYVLVTEERQKSTGLPNIPLICAALGVQFINLEEMIRREGWSTK